MKKMPTLFARDFSGDTATARDIVTPGCEWVLAGEGTASRKRDGTAIMVRGIDVYKRYDAKVRFATARDPEYHRIGVRDGKSEGFMLLKTVPEGFEPCCEPDGVTGHWPGWVPVGQNDPVIDKAIAHTRNHLFSGVRPPNGTYEVCGPSVGTRSGKNPERLEFNIAFPHGGETFNVPRSFDGIRAFLEQNPMEGIVWAHPDGRMVKIKSRDLGLEWPR